MIKAEFTEFENQLMEDNPFEVSSIFNDTISIPVLIDSGCLSYGVMDSRFAAKHQFPRIPCGPYALQSVERVSPGAITEAAYVKIDIGGRVMEKAYFYIVPKIEEYPVILGKPWLRHEKAVKDVSAGTLTFKDTGTVVHETDTRKYDHRGISAAGLALLTHGKTRRKVTLFAASLADINKALQHKELTDPATKLPAWLNKRLRSLFDRREADKLPPHRPGVDHKIELERDAEGKTPAAPWGPLYNMSRDELLVLRKTLTELLDKNFVRVSNSPAAAPVLFVRKPGGGLRFCCDYRALNKLTRKDRYPLPLIQETLSRISKAKWFTKLDVVAAFHRIRVAEGDEWLTAFRTRFGLFEWLVTPFGLANAPSTFQRYINSVLQEFLDDFVSAYVDDVLIFTDGTREEHRRQVHQVLDKLQAAGLQLDIDKCEFEVKSTKYLGFIVEAGKGLRMDPAKVAAIKEWQPPKSAKGVSSFIGFANFYRRFIKDYSKMTAPLHDLTRKDREFHWNQEASRVFEALKHAFVTAPVLAQFDPDKETILETDSSGYCTGGILSQYDEDGLLRPVAFFSKKNTPAECNYEIHDKEMLAIIKCLQEWEAELKSVGEFTILTDHKNLEYFSKIRKLSERQMRWQLILSKFQPVIRYRPGKQGQKPDVLSRREQDLPVSMDDERLQYRMARLIPEGMIRCNTIRMKTRRNATVLTQSMNAQAEITPEDEMLQLWEEGKRIDVDHEVLIKAVRDGKRTFSSDLEEPVKVSIADCTLTTDGSLLFRGRRWVPNHEPLKTRLIQETHDSVLAGHPGRNGTIGIMRRHFFWPNMQTDIRRFVRNCDVCGRTKVWRDRKQGLLKPLPIPLHQWKDIAMDFIGPLPASQGHSHLLVITDRLGKGVELAPCKSLDIDYVARLFLQTHYCHHGPPATITSDRGPQFTSRMWKRVCQLLGIKRQLSTSFHPETDGQTERANTEVERLLRQWVNYQQNNWVDMLPAVQLSLNGRESTTTGVSPFFLSHGYHLEPFTLFDEPITEETLMSPERKGDMIVARLKDATDWAQLTMAGTQQEQERQADRHRNAAPAYKMGDKVWLNLKNIRTTRPSKKLDSRAGKFTILEAMGPQTYRLDVPSGVHNVFNVDLLRPAGTDPLPSQRQDDTQPPPVLIEGQEEHYLVEGILDQRVVRGRGRRGSKKLQYLVKWVGYAEPDWQPAENLEDTEALENYLRQQGRHPDRGRG
jgi:RNase H-like domain found in reverse transcriptase/Reverse transcriptase (RNA-dependent DNA polymerase)/Integrase zinc binding domain/Chromo (CHRromatin Organisation MOdifier) domain